jgi:hypothetical protein
VATARHAVEAFRMVATNAGGGVETPGPNGLLKGDCEEEGGGGGGGRRKLLEEARQLAAQKLKDIGLETAMREALKKTPPGKRGCKR